MKKFIFITFLVSFVIFVSFAMSSAREKDEPTILFEQLAKSGDVAAQVILGLRYQNGDGYLQNDKEAFKWFRLAAKQNSLIAHMLLGLMYYQGSGVDKNYKKAFKHFKIAAEKDIAMAQGMLGGMYLVGEYVKKDYIKAHMWVNLASSQGLEMAKGLRKFLAKNMTPHQIEQAQVEAKKWMAKHTNNK